MSGAKMASCLRKIAYVSWEAAEAAALKVMDESPDGGGPLVAYRCDFGEHYHIGHLVRPKGGKRGKYATA